MSSPVLAFAKTVGVTVAALAGLLATISGCVAAVDWASATFGGLAVVGVGAFVAGCVLTHAVHQAVCPARVRLPDAERRRDWLRSNGEGW